MQILRDWNTFRWSRITLLSGDPAAKVIRVKVHMFSDSTLCVGVSNLDPSNKWATQLEDVWNEHEFVEENQLGTYYQVLPSLMSRSML